MTIEVDDAVLDRGCLADTVRVAIVYIFDRLRDGVEQSHPDRHGKDWYRNFLDDVYRASRLRRLLEVLDPTEKKEATCSPTEKKETPQRSCFEEAI